MKKILLIFMLLFTSNSMIYASFPVTTNEVKSEVIVDATDDIASSLPTAQTVFKFGPFLVGLLFGLIGVGLVYIFSDDSDARRSAWYGLGTWLILLLLLVGAAG